MMEIRSTEIKDLPLVMEIYDYARAFMLSLIHISRRPEYVRASSGTCRFEFKPQLDKSFSRGFTHYFLHGRCV